ncbi:MAG: hypothetical protein ACREPR_26695, partial [Brasilonema sp.]
LKYPKKTGFTGQEGNPSACISVAMSKSLHPETDPYLKLGKTKGVPAKKKVQKPIFSRNLLQQTWDLYQLA